MLKKSLKKMLGGKKEHDPDWSLILIVGIIIAFGLIMLASASSAYAYYRYHDGYYFIKHQITRGLLPGLLLFFIFARVDYRFWRKYALWALGASILLLSLVFVPGLSLEREGISAKSWINLFGFSLQPAELVKLTFLIYLAAWLENRKQKLHDLYQGIAPFVIVLGVIALLMLKQPDLGTLSIIGLTSLIAYFVAGGKIKHIFIFILLGLIVSVFLIRAKPYQAQRFKCFSDPSYSVNEYCYQINQSLIAVGSGGLWGAGLGASKQKLLYLPEVSGDSIFAIIGEELGFVFTSIVVIFFVALFYRGFLIARKTKDDFGKILATGIVSWLTLQAIINIGGMINILPITGVPLPFISYGGTALTIGLTAIGLLVNISKKTTEV